MEEAVVNAIYHRSYEEREPVEVRITPQELAVGEQAGTAGGNATAPVTDQVADQVTDQVERAILGLCRQPRSATEIREHVGLRHRKHFQDNYLRPMMEAGWIARTIPDRPQSRLQRTPNPLDR